MAAIRLSDHLEVLDSSLSRASWKLVRLCISYTNSWVLPRGGETG